MARQTAPTQIDYFADQYSGLGKGPVSVTPYISPEYFEQEREYVFKRTRLHIAREEELPSPGDYLVKEVAVLKTSILLVRGANGKIRAFHMPCPTYAPVAAFRFLRAQPDPGERQRWRR